MTQSKITKYGAIAGLLAGGLIAGGVLASTGTASAASSTPTAPPAATRTAPTNPNPGDLSKPQRSDETLLTGDTAAKVRAVALAEYPGATVQRVETDSDGVYEAHIVSGGNALIVQVGKDFTITGTQTMGQPPAGGRGPANGASPQAG